MVGFVGPFGDRNYGDYAMLINNVKTMKLRDFILFIYEDDSPRELFELYFEGCNVKYCLIKSSVHYREQKKEKYNVKYERTIQTPLDVLNSISNIEEVRSSIAGIDELIVCGGGYLNHYWTADHRIHKTISILGAILLANEQRKRIVFLGNTFGPFKESSMLYSLVFNSLHNASFAARDRLLSLQQLRSLGITERVDVIPDDLYILDSSLIDKKPPIVQGEYAVLEIYPSLDEVEQNIESIIKMNDKLDEHLVLLPMGAGFGGQYQAKIIKEYCPRISCFSENTYLSIEDCNNIVKNAKFMLCHRYHLLLTAVSNNVPCIQILKNVQGDNIYYYSKARGLLDQVFSNQVYQETAFLKTDLWQTINEVTENQSDYLPFLQQKALFNTFKVEAEERMKDTRGKYLAKIGC